MEVLSFYYVHYGKDDIRTTVESQNMADGILSRENP